MRRIPLLLALVAAVFAPGQLMAQDSTDPDAATELRSMVVERSAENADRDVILDFLGQEAVGDVAAQRGFDVDAMKDDVRAMDDEASADLARRVQDIQSEAGQVGGDTLVITSTTVVIVLLVLILIAI